MMKILLKFGVSIINKIRDMIKYLHLMKLVKDGLQLGNNVSIQKDVIIDAKHCYLISIGDNCIIAPRVQILAHDASTKIFLGYTKLGLVSIGENTFIGAGSIILPNVKIGKNVIIGAGSVVTNDIPDNSVAVGIPARVICALDDYLDKYKSLMKKRPQHPSKGWTMRGGISEENRKKLREELEAGICFVE